MSQVWLETIFASGFLSIGHNKLRDNTAEHLTEVCHSVPTLQNYTGEQFSYGSAIVEDGA